MKSTRTRIHGRVRRLASSLCLEMVLLATTLSPNTGISFNTRVTQGSKKIDTHPTPVRNRPRSVSFYFWPLTSKCDDHSVLPMVGPYNSILVTVLLLVNFPNSKHCWQVREHYATTTGDTLYLLPDAKHTKGMDAPNYQCTKLRTMQVNCYCRVHEKIYTILRSCSTYCLPLPCNLLFLRWWPFPHIFLDLAEVRYSGLTSWGKPW